MFFDNFAITDVPPTTAAYLNRRRSYCYERFVASRAGVAGSARRGFEGFWS